MSNNIISRIQLPDGITYDIVSTDTAAIESTYDSGTQTVTLIVSNAVDVDSTEF